MSKQNNFRLSKTKNNILYILSGVSLALFAGLMLFPTISESTHAEGDEPDDGITITVNGEVDANLILFDEGDYKIAKDTVSVSSSAAYGYELFLTTDSEAHQSIYLNDDPTSSSKISPVSGTVDEPAALTSNTWGFAIPGQGNFDNEYSTTSPDPNSHFAIIPTTNDQAVYENNSAAADDDIDFYYGIKIEPTLEPGEYTTSASYTAIAKIPPLTAKAVLGENGNLNFLYNRNTYAVGETYTDQRGETVIASVYDNIPLDGTSEETFPWAEQSDSIFTAGFDRSFDGFMPTNTSKWFRGLRKLHDINLSGFNTSRSTDLSHMFDYAGYDATDDFYVRGTLSLCTNRADASYLFYYAGYNAERFTIEYLSINICTGVNFLNMSHMFDHAAYNVDQRWDFQPFDNYVNIWSGEINYADMSYMFAYFGYSAQDDYILHLPKRVYSPTSISHIFDHAGYSALGDFAILHLEDWIVNDTKDMSYAFAYAGYTTSRTFDVRDVNHWYTGEVTNMEGMFYYAGYHAGSWLGSFGSWTVSRVTNHDNFINLNYSSSNRFVVNHQPNWRN